MDLPVYLFTGFLESGKTRTIQDALESRDFNTGEKTLLLVCEEGIEEYDPERFWGKNVWLEQLTSENMLNESKLTALASKRPYDRIVVEFNGMWLVSKFYEAMPEGAYVTEQVFIADSSTFENYNSNMRSLVVDKLQNAQFVIFNRCTPQTDRMKLHKIVRGTTRGAGICYEFTDGHVENDEIEDPLPFDVNAPVITVEDRDYALWYRDLMEKTAEYDGKTVSFTGVAAVDERMPSGSFALGRHVMTCCAADIQYMGLVCVDPVQKLRPVSYGWYRVTARIAVEKNRLYRGKGPVLHITSIERGNKPAEEVATFY
jgi:G3E family GTPase